MPGPRRVKTRQELAEEALILLEVKPEDVLASPRIEHLFKGIGGKEKVFVYLAGSEEPEARKLLELRSRLTRDQRKAVPFEAYCIAAEVSTKKMFGIISQEVVDQSAKATELLAKARHPEVVEATIRSALTLTGDKDRKMLHQAQGFVPIPKTAVTNVFGNIDARRQKVDVAVLPPVEDGIRKLSDRFNSGLSLPPPVEAVFEEGDEDGDEED